MTIQQRLTHLEQRILAQPDTLVDGSTAIGHLADILARDLGLPPDDATAERDRLVWVLDQLDAPTHMPGHQLGTAPVGMSQAERVAALLGMTVQEFKAALQRT